MADDDAGVGEGDGCAPPGQGAEEPSAAAEAHKAALGRARRGLRVTDTVIVAAGKGLGEQPVGIGNPQVGDHEPQRAQGGVSHPHGQQQVAELPVLAVLGPVLAAGHSDVHLPPVLAAPQDRLSDPDAMDPSGRQRAGGVGGEPITHADTAGGGGRLEVPGAVELAPHDGRRPDDDRDVGRDDRQRFAAGHGIQDDEDPYR